MEIWKDVIGYEGIYQINKNGDVKSLKRNTPGTFTTIDKIIKKQIDLKGYFVYKLSKNGKTTTKSLHRLIAIHFIENPNNEKCVNHKDGNRLNNDISNLEWCSYSYNSLHGYKNNGRINSRRKLTNNLVLEIREKLKNPYHGIGNDLANEYNVSKWIISLIKNFKSYMPYENQTKIPPHHCEFKAQKKEI
jgi:hypothetical protein